MALQAKSTSAKKDLTAPAERTAPTYVRNVSKSIHLSNIL